MLIICAYLSHFNMLLSLPEYKQQWYIRSQGNTCKQYNKRRWNVVDKTDVKGNTKIVIANNVIQIDGWLFEIDKHKGESYEYSRN